MSITTLPIPRIDAGLSTRARVRFGAPHANPAFVGAPSAFGHSFGDAVGSTVGNGSIKHMNTAWLGGGAESACVDTTYVTKRITTGILVEVST